MMKHIHIKVLLIIALLLHCTSLFAKGMVHTMALDIMNDSIPYNISFTNPPCGDTIGGSIDIEIIDSLATMYTYIWQQESDTTVISTDQDITNLSTGTYYVIITDTINNDIALDTVTLSEIPLIELEQDTVMTACYGDAIDTLIVSSIGGADTTYTYFWDNEIKSDTLTNLSAGSYTVTISDGKGCSVMDSLVVVEPDSIMLVMDSITVTCNGLEDGTAIVIASGGTVDSLYTYLWNNGNTTDTINNLPAGIYIVTVTDDNGCIAIDSTIVNEPDTLSITILQDILVSCPGGNDGQATVSITGGTIPYTYNWDNGETDTTAYTLTTGIHEVTVTDNNSCEITDSIYIDSIPFLTISLENTSPANCTACDGAADITVIGGTAPYTYSWSNGNANEDPTDLCADINTLTVTDSKGCSTTIEVNIGSISTLLIDNISEDESILCAGECTAQATANITGGTMPYTYEWDNGATTATASDLCAGIHTVTVSDVSGCIFTESITIAEPAQLNGTTTINQNVSCVGENDGSATVNATGGTPPYTYLWDNGETTNLAVLLSAGTHIVTVTDNNGCSFTASVEIGSPTPLIPGDISSTPVSCYGGNDGTATVGASGGTPPYSYLWDNGQMDSTITDLNAGVYSVIISDSNDCELPPINVTVIQPAEALSANSPVVTNNITCVEDGIGEVTITVNGGTPPYTYIWEDAESFSDDIALYTVPGTYGVNITDSNGCSPIDSTFTIDFDNSPQITDFPELIVLPNGTPEDINIITIPSETTLNWTIITSVNMEFSEEAGQSISPLNLDFSLIEGGSTGSATLEVCPETGLCDSTCVSITLRILPGESPIFIPDIFSPNDDGINDQLAISLRDDNDPDDFAISIFGRNGQKIYEANTIDIRWDGESYPDGTYYYVIVDKINNRKYKGAVSILR